MSVTVYQVIKECKFPFDIVDTIKLGKIVSDVYFAIFKKYPPKKIQQEGKRKVRVAYYPNDFKGDIRDMVVMYFDTKVTGGFVLLKQKSPQGAGASKDCDLTKSVQAIARSDKDK